MDWHRHWFIDPAAEPALFETDNRRTMPPQDWREQWLYHGVEC